MKKEIPLLSWLTWAALAFTWLLPLLHFSRLPAIIPTHFNAAGEVDGTGNRLTVFLLPVVGTFTLLLLGAVNRFPALRKKPFTLTPRLAEKLYSDGRFLQWIGLLCALLFAFIEWTVIVSATTGEVPGYFWVIWIFTAALTLLPLIQVFRYRKNK